MRHKYEGKSAVGRHRGKKLFERVQPSSRRDNSNDGVRNQRAFLHASSPLIANFFVVRRTRRTVMSKAFHELRLS